MPEITSIGQLGELVRRGGVDWREYGDVYTNEDADLILFNYSAAAQYNNRWNWLERNSRGLIFEKATGQVVARPFPKFFNWGQTEYAGPGEIAEITEKVDGSLIILFHYNDEWRTATRGSLSSDQAQKAREMLHQREPLLKMNPDMTYLFEIVYPQNRIVVNYGDVETLYLLAVIVTETGEEHYPHHVMETVAGINGWELPMRYGFTDVESILERLITLDANHEGWVVKFTDGSRWKFKGQQYLELHKMLSGMSKRRVFEAMRNGLFEELRERIPDEWDAQLMDWHNEIMTAFSSMTLQAEMEFMDSPGRDAPRKEFALWVKRYNRNLQSLLFLLYDDRDIEVAVWKQIGKLLEGDTTSSQPLVSE